MIGECNLSNGGQHCFVGVGAWFKDGLFNVYSCPTCGLTVKWEDLEGWIRLYEEDGIWSAEP